MNEEPCKNCNGTGKQRGPNITRTKDRDVEFVKQDCVYCKGTGKVAKVEKVEEVVP